jgi:hypothetical protein
MSKRKGELSDGMIDTNWPHQVAVHIDLVRGFHFEPKMEFSRSLSTSPRRRSLTVCWPGRRCEEYCLYCFAKRADAQAFIDRFGGEHFDPGTNRGKGKQRDYWMRDTMGDRRQRYPEILGRLEQALGDEPSLDHDISWLLALPATLWFTRRRRDVESLLRARLPLGEWTIDLEPAIDARLRAHPAADWHQAWRLPMPAIKNEAIALSLAFLRSMGEQFQPCAGASRDTSPGRKLFGSTG